MQERMEIRITKIDEMERFAFSGLLGADLLLLIAAVEALSVALLVVFFLVIVGLGILVLVYYRRPTVVIADAQTLQYQHIFGKVTIPLNSIRRITCEPYTHLIRQIPQQRIRLIITTADAGDYELNDCLDAGALVNDRLNDTYTEIPLMQLYAFLRARTR